MADIFISYARSTATQAQAVAQALRAQGYGVWLDDAIPAHRAYADVIEEELKAAAAVVVVWSAEAVKSQWVQSEADHAREAGKLVQLSIDGAMLPMPFDRIQCADLAGWTGDLDAPGWRRVIGSIATLAGGAKATALAAAPVVEALPEGLLKPSIAVMPFANLSTDPEQDYFVDGVVEEIVSALSRFKSIFVISAGDSLVSEGKAISPQDAARQLGVRYVLEGSVRKAGGRVRISVHLVDASNGAEIWADRLDDTMDDVFALQDRVAARVAGVIENTVQDVDTEKAAKRPTANMGSYDLYLRSMPLFRLSRKAEMLTSIDLLDQAIALDPGFAGAMSQSCVCHRQVIDHGWSENPEKVRRRGLELAEGALRLAGEDARVLAQVAVSLPGLEGRLDRAVVLMDRAIALNPASPFVFMASGSLRLKCGEPDLAAEHLETAMRLDPISTQNGFVRMYLASARFQQERFDEALALFRTTAMRLPISYAVLAALHGHLGQISEAQEALAQFESQSIGTIEEAARIWFPRPEHCKLFLDGIALAEGKSPAASPG
ncbi:MAG TPA: TIR domain-containing protein [Caulobacteraceae bacterium]